MASRIDQDIGELTAVHVQEQISVLRQCVGNNRKYNQLIEVLGAVKVAE